MKIDPRNRKAIEDVILRREQATSMAFQLKEDVKAIAEELGLRVAQLNRIISLVEKERAKGAVLAEEQDILEAAEDLTT